MSPTIVLIFLVFQNVLGEVLYKFSDDFIEEINQQAETWQAGRNFPANITEEYLRQYIIADKSYFNNLERPSSSERKAEDPLYLQDDDIPEFFDARQYWSKCKTIGDVLNTGPCKAAQIFAVTSAFTDRRCIRNGGKNNEVLSTEYLVSCCKICRYDASKMCDHGSVYRTWHFLHKRGAITGSHFGSHKGCQPSTIAPCSHYGESSTLPDCRKAPLQNIKCHTRCTNPDYETGFFKDKHKSTQAYWVKETVQTIQSEILAHGPVTGTFELNDDFYHYKRGVYIRTPGSKAEMYLHSAKLIGWGKENGVPYWLLINTWGPDWGDKGTFKIRRGTFECALEYLIAAAIPKN